MNKTVRDDSQIIAERIRLARKSAGITQAQVAETLRLHRVSVTGIEAGQRKLFATYLLPLANMFGVSVSWIVGETDPETSLAEDRVNLAARGLVNFSDEDLDRLWWVIRAMRHVGKDGIIPPQGKKVERGEFVGTDSTCCSQSLQHT